MYNVRGNGRHYQISLWPIGCEMRKDSRLSRVLHVLLHMYHAEKTLTSEQIAEMVGTNPVVIRRTMGLLKNNHYVRTEKGPNGGWILNCNLDEVSLYDIYLAIGKSPLFTIAMDHEDTPCTIEQAVNKALINELSEAEHLLLNRFKDIKLSALLQ